MAPRLARLVGITVFIATMVLLVAPSAGSHADAAPVFDQGYATKPAPLGVQPQWLRLLSTASLQTGSTPALWQDLHDDTRDKHPLRQLENVNTYFNRLQYGRDSAVYGASDYWASPAEFIARGFGDCEDYSIAKYAALRAMGWAADALLIVVIRDLKNSLDHAALAARFEDQWYVLDNRAQRVLKPADVPFYQPVYAINENQLLVFERSLPNLQAAVRERRERNLRRHSG